MGSLHLLRTAFDDDDNHNNGPTIVGMWHALFHARTMNGQTIPNGGAMIDNAMVTWHSEHTEVMASNRPPQNGHSVAGQPYRKLTERHRKPDRTRSSDGDGYPESGRESLLRATHSHRLRPELQTGGDFFRSAFGNARDNEYVNRAIAVKMERVKRAGTQ